MSILPSRRRPGFTILESLTLIAICVMLLLVAVPVLLVRAGVLKPAKPVEQERPKDLVPKQLKSADPDFYLRQPEAPRLPEDAKVPERMRTEPLKPAADSTPVPPVLPEMQPKPSAAPAEKPEPAPASQAPAPSPAPQAAAPAPGPQAPATPPPAMSPALPGEDAKK